MESGQVSKLTFPIRFGPYIQKATSSNKFSWPTRDLRVSLWITRLISLKVTHILLTLWCIRIIGASICLKSRSKENFFSPCYAVLMSPLLYHIIFLKKKKFVTVMNYPVITHYLAKPEEQVINRFQFSGVCLYLFLSSVNFNMFIVFSWSHLHQKCYQEIKYLTSWWRYGLLKIQRCGFISPI